MTKPLPIDDFRAIRIILEPDDFALTDGKLDVPTDLIDEETWRHIMMLPDDVSIRTSNHQGKLIRKLNELNSVWVECTSGYDEDVKDILQEVLIHMTDELDAILFNALHGYYRQAIGCLRNVLELVVYGTLWQITGDVAEFEEWNSGQKQMSFTKSCDKLSKKDRIQPLETYLREILSDSLFDKNDNPDGRGWTRRLYDELCRYSHSRPYYTNAGMWQSNGPIYRASSFKRTYLLYYDVTALSYLLIKLAKPDFILPDEIKTHFRSSIRNSTEVLYESYKFLFGRPSKRKLQKESLS